MNSKPIRRAFLRRFFLIWIAALALSGPVAASDDATAASFQVAGAVIKPRTWTVAQLTTELAADVKTVDYTLKSVKAQARCVPLLAVMNAAGLRINPNVKNHRLAFVVLVRGGDGYTVGFSIPEILPEMGNRDVWIALDRDGQALAGEEGPVALIVPSDVKPGRWVHGVARIQVIDEIDAAAPATSNNDEKSGK